MASLTAGRRARSIDCRRARRARQLHQSGSLRVPQGSHHCRVENGKGLDAFHGGFGAARPALDAREEVVDLIVDHEEGVIESLGRLLVRAPLNFCQSGLQGRDVTIDSLHRRGHAIPHTLVHLLDGELSQRTSQLTCLGLGLLERVGGGSGSVSVVVPRHRERTEPSTEYGVAAPRLFPTRRTTCVKKRQTLSAPGEGIEPPKISGNNRAPYHSAPPWNDNHITGLEPVPPALTRFRFPACYRHTLM